MKYKPPQPQSYSAETAALITQLKDRIKRLEEQLMDVKNQYAVLLADVALYEDRGERIKRLEAELEQTKQDRNAIAKNTREPLLLQLDHANERIKRLEDRIHRASMAFFEDVPDDSVASGMLEILEEERGKK